MKQTLLSAMLAAIVLSQSTLAATGTWTPLTNVNNNNGAALLLTDGTVMMNREQGTAWNRLTPDASGSYINGTWSPLASMHDSRGLFASAVLNDGRVFVAGGEYGSGGSTVEIYDPVANTWSYVASWTGGKIADSTAKVLPDGRVLLCTGNNNFCWIYNPANDSWSKTSSKLFLDSNAEESVVQLPDGSFLNVDDSSGNSQRYIPASNQWLDAGNTGALTSNGGSPGIVAEIGPGLLLYDGRALYLGATGNTAFYAPGTNSWAAGPVIPNGLECGDKPSAVLPNGHVLVGAGNNGVSVPVTTAIFDFDPVANAYVDTGEPSSCGFFLVLPTGQVLAAATGGNFIYTPAGGPNSAWRPTISAIAHNADGSYSIYGTQLNGLTEGAAFGDDAQSATNYPIIQLTNGSNVSYAKSYNFSTMGVATGGALVGARFSTAIPANGTYTLSVIANGVASNPVPFGVFGAVPAPAITSPLTATIIETQPFSYLVTASNGADPASFTVTALPAGLSATGPLITGAPTVAGTFNISLSASNAGGTGSATLVLTVIPSPVINSALTASAAVGTPFSYTITASNGPTSFNAWRLPAGLSVNTATGVISGTPAAAGTSYVTIGASNAAGSGTATLVLTVYVPPVITSALTASGTVGKTFRYTITASNSPTSFNATGLPPGLSYLFIPNGPQGWIFQTPTTAGTYNVTISDTNPAGTATATLVLTINTAAAGAPVISSSNGASGTVGSAFSYTIAASNSPTSFNAKALPAGLSINTVTGLISGTPTVAGTYDVTISATNASGTDAENLNLVINPPAVALSITTTSPLLGGDVGTPYYQIFSAVGFAQPYSWSLWLVSSGTLPAGMTLSPDGILSGTPTTTATSNFTLTFTDWMNNSVSKAFALTINSAPSITTASLPNGTAGTAYSQTLNGSGGTTPYIFTVSSGAVPAGLALSSAGVLNGTPTAAGTSNFTVTLTDAAAGSATQSYSVTIGNGVSISITTASPLPAGDVGTAYSQTFAATGGSAPYSWVVTSGTLPAGLTLSSAGVLSGTPTAAGTSTFTIQATDSVNNTGSSLFTLTVNAAPSITTTSPLAAGDVNTAYSQTFVVSGGTAPFTWSVSAGALPSGLTLSSAGVLSGTPTAAGTSNFTVKATDAIGAAPTKAFALTINAALAITTASPLPAGDVSTAYSQTFAAFGGTAPLSWSVSAGSLPAGLTLSSAGILSGTPTAAGTSNFTVKVTDAAGAAPTKAFALTINAALAITTASPLATGDVGTAYSKNFAASGGTSPFTWSVSSGALPSGLTLSAGGVLNGTPTAAGTFNFTVKIADAAGAAPTKAFALTINSTPAITTTSLPNGTVSAVYSQTLGISGGTSPFTWTVSSGTLPAGLALNSVGVLSGTPATAGTSTFTVNCTDAAGAAPTQVLTLTINSAPPLTPVINSALTATGTVGTSFNYTITATHGPTSYNAVTLPPGLSVNTATGVISGTPTASGTSSVLLSATNATGTGTATLSLTINAATNQPPVIASAATATPNPATAAQSVTLAVAASDPNGDPLTYAWTFGDGTSGSGSSATHAYASAGTYAASVTITDGKGGSVTSSVSVVVNPSLSSGLVAYWKLDDASATTALDSSGNGYNGSLVNGPVWTTGKIAGGLSFDGVNDHVDVANVNHNVGTGDFTWTTWTNPQRLSNPWEGLMANGEYSPALYSKLYTAGQWGIYWGGDKPSGNTLTTGRWYHLAVIRQGGVIKFYQDGVQTSQTYAVSTSMANGPIHLGASGVASGARYGQADLDDVRFYNRALSASEIAALANPAPTAQSITTQPADSITMTVSKVQGAVKFTGSGHDMAVVTGVIPNVSAGFDPAGQQLMLSIDGAAVPFTLDGKGRGKSAQGIVSLRFKSSKRNPSTKKAEFQGGNVAFAAKIMNGTWAAVWNLDPTKNSKNVSMALSTTLMLGDAVYDSTVNVMYSSKAGVGGKFAK